MRGQATLECAATLLGVCKQGIAIKCDDQTDCPTGQLCCGTFDESSGYRSVQCQTQCSTTTPDTISVRFCDPDAPVDECQSSGHTCQPSDSLSGYSICR